MMTNLNLRVYIDINECEIELTCKNGGLCENTNGSYICNCTTGFNGTNCETGILLLVGFFENNRLPSRNSRRRD